LVPFEQSPPIGKIRNSNGPMLGAAVACAGATPIDLGIAVDHPTRLANAAAEGLRAADVLVLSGAVSAGTKDFVPQVLSDLGVAKVFHKVRLKPGKPVWFGVHDNGTQHQLVFGLPGNPVSALVSFRLLVRAALDRLAGREMERPKMSRLPLAAPFEHRGARPTYYPVRAAQWRGGAPVETLRWQGSADLATLAHATGLAHFPAGAARYAAGTDVEVLPI
jgi:molybdopterin molybdotransferase